jgi:outer membrane immunogenic protein
MGMKKLLLAGVGVAAWVGSAMAADMPLKAMPVAPPAYSWTGCYIGANAGNKSASTSNGLVSIAPAVGPGGPSPASSVNNDTSASTNFGGGQLGCNYQMGWLVLGVEGDGEGQAYHATRTLAGVPPALFLPGDVFDYKSDWQASIRGRMGIAYDRLLIYVTGGGGFTNLKVTTNFVAAPPFPAAIATASSSLSGTTAGGGFEYAFWQNASIGVEGRATWYGSHTFNAGTVATSGGPPFTFAPVTQTFKYTTAEFLARLNWKFY